MCDSVQLRAWPAGCDSEIGELTARTRTHLAQGAVRAELLLVLGGPRIFFRVAPTGGAVFLLGQLGKVKIFLAPFKVSLGDCRSRARPPSAPMHLAQKALTEPARRSRNRFLGIFRTFSQTRQKVRKPSQGPAAKHEGQLRSHPDTPTLAPAQYQ